jgi:hypothetical protein
MTIHYHAAAAGAADPTPHLLTRLHALETRCTAQSAVVVGLFAAASGGATTIDFDHVLAAAFALIDTIELDADREQVARLRTTIKIEARSIVAMARGAMPVQQGVPPETVH